VIHATSSLRGDLSRRPVMRSIMLPLACLAALCFTAADAGAVKNDYGKWALHDAGDHNAKLNTCAFVLSNCWPDANVMGRTGAGREDIYVIAADVEGIAGTRFGICCDGPVFFYGWTSCGDFDVATVGWPACGGGNSIAWSGEQPGPNVTVGILDTYVYTGTQGICLCVDPRVGYAEWCDGTEPLPQCLSISPDNPNLMGYFSCVGFNGSPGFNACIPGPVEQRSWGAVKSLYR
jgi:hypothetical protein